MPDPIPGPERDPDDASPLPGGEAAGSSPIEVPDDLSALDDAPPAPTGAGSGPAAEGLSVEDLLSDVERLTAERDATFDRLQRAQAEFENARRRLVRDAEERADAVAGRLVEDLLPVLDACDAALGHGEAAVEPILTALLQVLERNGLERIDPGGEVFDPTRHEAVMHEPAGPDDDPALSVVSEVLRIGYAWKGRVVRAAMVKVRG